MRAFCIYIYNSFWPSRDHPSVYSHGEDILLCGSAAASPVFINLKCIALHYFIAWTNHLETRSQLSCQHGWDILKVLRRQNKEKGNLNLYFHINWANHEQITKDNGSVWWIMLCKLFSKHTAMNWNCMLTGIKKVSLIICKVCVILC